MNTFIKIFSGLLVVAFFSLLGATFIWLMWPFIFPVIFPKAIEAGILIAKIPWHSALALFIFLWIFKLMVTALPSTSEKKETEK